MSAIFLAPFGSDDFSALRALLFGNNEQGLWPRPDQFGSALTQYKESTGQNIVTAIGDTVGLAIDWRLGRTLGAELVTNGTFDTNLTGWTVGSANSAAWNNGEADVTLAGALSSTANNWFSSGVPVLTGDPRFFVVEFDATWVSGASLQVGTAYVASLTIAPNGGVKTRYAAICGLRGGTGLTVTPSSVAFGASGGSARWKIDNVTCKELPGNHAYQATASKRPLLACVPARGRVNEYITTETLASWGQTAVTTTDAVAVAPDGTLTASRIRETDTTGGHLISQTLSQYTGSRTQTVYVKADGRGFAAVTHRGTSSNAVINLTTGAVTESSETTVVVTDEGNGWWKVVSTATWTGSGVTNTNIYSMQDGVFANRSFLGDVTKGILVWHPQMENGSSSTNYQRVGAGIYDVTEVGQPTLYGWLSDGVDDNFETNAFDPGTDKVTVVAGVRKLSDAITIITEFSTNVNTNNGSLFMTVSDSGTPTPGYSFASKGTARGLASIATGYAAPISNVVSGVGDISGDIARLRVNGTQVATSAIDQGTGNYTSHKGYIFSRAGTSLFYNGYLFALCLRFAATDSSLLSRLENFTAVKTLGAKLS